MNYRLSPLIIPGAPPLKFSSGSDYISPYIPSLVIMGLGLVATHLKLPADETVRCLIFTDPSELARMAGIHQAHRAFWVLIKHWKSSSSY